MRVVEDLSRVPAGLPFPVVAIGTFDGVHLGHQAVLRAVVEAARRRNGTAVVLTFFPHPQQIIASGSAPPLLQTFDQQAEILDRLGVDILIRLPFTRQMSLWTPEEFVRNVLSPLGIEEVWVGRNFRFGHRRSGDPAVLEALGRRYGFRVQACAPVLFRGERISSTRIRRLIDQGRVEAAARLLGRAYEIRGDVVRGDGRGKHLGFPTANVQPANLLWPANGVYVSGVELDGHWWVGATNVGFRPTLRESYGRASPVVETHLLDFSGDLYGRFVRIHFCCRVRPEICFRDHEALILRIKEDILFVRRYAARLERTLKDRPPALQPGA